MRTKSSFVIAVSVIGGVVLAGCLTHPPENKDHASIMVTLNRWKAAYGAHDVPALLNLFSEQYSSNGRNKAAEAERIRADFKEGGEVDPVINVANATITVQGTTADVAPITISGRTGSSTIRLTLQSEGGHWRVIKMDDK